MSHRYPYIVVRAMAAVYVRREVRFGTGESDKLLDPLWVDAEGPDDNGLLTDDATQELLATVRTDVMRRRFRMCLVLTPQTSVYVEPDGILEYSDALPSSKSPR